MPGGHIFNKDGTRMIKVRSTPQTPSLETTTTTSTTSTTAHDASSNGLSSEAVSGTTAASGSKKKKKKNRNKVGATHLDYPGPLNHESHTHHNHAHFDPSTQGEGEGEGDDAYYSDEDQQFAEPGYDGPSSQPPEELDAPTSKKSKKKKKKKATGSQAGAGSEAGHSQPHEIIQNPSQKSSKDRIWNTSTSEERERIKNFWLSLGEDERRSLVKVEKEAVLRKMKEQQKHSCSCSVCGRKRTAIEEELEVLYDAYYEELEHPSKGLPHSHNRRIEELPELEEDDDPYDDEDDYEDISEDGHRSVQQDFFNFGNSLTVREGGILTVADDLLKNDGKKFIEMMEQLAERRMAREEEASHAHGMNNQMHSGLQHNHSHMPNGSQDYEIDEDDDDYEEDEEDFDDEDEEEPDAMTEEQRMEEGRRMFQIFAARMFEQRVLSAYRERVAQERQMKLLEELEEEDRIKEEQKNRKAKEKEKKKDKKKQQKQQKEEERLRKEAEKAEEEAAQKALEEQKAEEARKRKEEQRLKREAEKKAADEERLKKEEERKRRLQEEREREHERERKRKEQQDREKKKKEELLRKQKEEREQREKERKEKEERDRKDREARRKVAEDKERARKEAESNVAVPKIATTPILTFASKVSTIASSHNLIPPTVVPAVVSPRLAVAAPALPKQTSPGKGKTASTRGSVASSPQTPKIQTRSSVTSTATTSQSGTPSMSYATTTAASNLNSGPTPGPTGSAKRAPGQNASTPLQHSLNPVSHPSNALQGHIAPQGFPPYISSLPGVLPPETFMPPPNQPPFLPPGHRPHGNLQSMFPPPGQMPFGMQNAFRGFPGGHNMNPPVPLGPPPGNLRGFPPHGRGLYMGDFSPLPQPMPGSNFPPPPGSPFMQRQENIPSGHQRQSSGDHNEINPVSTPKPIHRPTPIQRPSNAVTGGPISKVNVDELSTSLGSSALLGDDEPEEPTISKSDNVSPSRRGSNIPASRGVFGIPPGTSPFFLGPSSQNPPFGMLPSPSNTWGAPSPVPLFNSLAGGTWGPGAPVGAGWATEPNAGGFGHNQRRQTRLDVIRLLAVQIYQETQQPAKAQNGFMRLSTLQEGINASNQLNAPSEVTTDELLTVTEIEGDMQNGGGWFSQKLDEQGQLVIRFQTELDSERRRVSSTSGLGGATIGGPGEIGSPVVGSASSLPFSSRHNIAGSGVAGSPNVPHF